MTLTFFFPDVVPHTRLSLRIPIVHLKKAKEYTEQNEFLAKSLEELKKKLLPPVALKDSMNFSASK